MRATGLDTVRFKFWLKSWFSISRLTRHLFLSSLLRFRVVQACYIASKKIILWSWDAWSLRSEISDTLIVFVQLRMRPLFLSTSLIAIAFLYIGTRPATRLVILDRWDRDEAPLRIVPETYHALWNNAFSSGRQQLRKGENQQRSLLQQNLMRLQHPQKNPFNTNTFPPGGSPQLFGWTPEPYPDPLLDKTRCSLSFLPDKDIARMPNLRLCDPDWVLGTTLLQEVALKLHNFTETFTNQWDVGVVDNTRHRRLTQKADLSRFASPMQQSGMGLVRQMKFLPNQLMADNGGEDRHVALPQVELAVAVVRKVR